MSEQCLDQISQDKIVQIAVASAVGGARESELELASRLELSVVPENVRNEYFSRYIIFYCDGALCIRESPKGSPKAICVDFCAPALQYRQKKSQQPEAILKALGSKNRESTVVLDATAGWGLDSFLMASAGHRVIMVERSPILHALLHDGLLRAKESGVCEIVEAVSRMSLSHGEAANILTNPPEKPDVVYLDPMFPERKKSALVKKNMRILHGLLGAVEADDDLLTPALLCARTRVVVKRPRISPSLRGPKSPDYQTVGKANRFDVYLIVPSDAEG
jgi:16S rRNA (guanine1516-N2)-methyltransferase